jgi:diamine N-acetyltransferase
MGRWQIRDGSTGRDLDDLVRLNLAVHELHVGAEPGYFRRPDHTEVVGWFRDVLDGGDYHVLVAETDGDVVGYLLYEVIDRPDGTFRRASRTVYVHQLAVEPAARSRGIGRGLLDAARRRAETVGATRVELDTWAFNHDAVTFFRRCGFETYNLRLRTDTSPPDHPPPR